MRTVVLTIAGSDPTGGAGLEADLQTLRELGLHGMAVSTAATVQDTSRVHRVVPAAGELVAAQLAALLADWTPDAVKVGMLGDGAVAAAVAAALATLPADVPVVLDPVLVSSSGAALLDDAGLEVLMSSILPRSTVVTPNHEEAVRMTGAADDASPAELCARIRELGGKSVVITGGDGSGGGSVDFLLDGDEITELEMPRFEGPSPHGTGCAFSTAVSAALAVGEDVTTAVTFAKELVHQFIADAAVPAGSSGRPMLGLGTEDDDGEDSDD